MSSLTCQITIKGNGVGRYGHPKTDRTGPLSEFLVDNQVFYKEICKHLRSCTSCDVIEVMNVYLQRRMDPKKSNGKVSQSLLKQSTSLEKIAQKKNIPIPAGLMGEFLWRRGIQGMLEGNLTIREKYNAIKLEIATEKNIFLPSDLSTMDKHLVQMVREGVVDNATDDEIVDLMSVAEVMYS